MNNNALWRSLDAWPLAQRPAVWQWLQHPGSLTKMLRAAAGPAFHVRVVHEGQTRLDQADAELLLAPADALASERSVFLCAAEPWVYAHTLALQASAHWLDKLGATPLGERVFAHEGAQRSNIEAALLDHRHALYQAAVGGQRIIPPELWARRSILKVEDHRLLIYECFLPGMTT
ncbi:MAG: chorismate lyase [Gammaproteobacteria bacterium]|nr:chorismate lyase [Gammaproteobacteria bacterium]MDE2345361.1 chorismate lyase [Gammaproteobacteria bacterium]